MASDWLAAVLSAYQMSGLKIVVQITWKSLSKRKSRLVNPQITIHLSKCTLETKMLLFTSMYLQISSKHSAELWWAPGLLRNSLALVIIIVLLHFPFETFSLWHHLWPSITTKLASWQLLVFIEMTKCFKWRPRLYRRQILSALFL